MHLPTSLIHPMDIAGSIFSLLSTVYYVKADKLAWPFGLVAILINIFLYGITGIYGDTVLEFIYLLSTFYGWYYWTKGKNKKALPITNITFQHSLILIILSTISIYVVSKCLIHFTNSQVPYWDAITTVLSLCAQWLTCRKIIQTWIVWFIVDAMYVGLYFYKGIPAHSILLLIYLGLAIAGYLRWYRLMKPVNYLNRLSKITQ